jgi:hypothetical protein
LTWAIEQNKGVVCKFIELINEPVDVLNEVLHAVDKSTIGPKVLELLDIVEGD